MTEYRIGDRYNAEDPTDRTRVFATLDMMRIVAANVFAAVVYFWAAANLQEWTLPGEDVCQGDPACLDGSTVKPGVDRTADRLHSFALFHLCNIVFGVAGLALFWQRRTPGERQAPIIRTTDGVMIYRETDNGQQREAGPHFWKSSAWLGLGFYSIANVLAILAFARLLIPSDGKGLFDQPISSGLPNSMDCDRSDPACRAYRVWRNDQFGLPVNIFVCSSALTTLVGGAFGIVFAALFAKCEWDDKEQFLATCRDASDRDQALQAARVRRAADRFAELVMDLAGGIRRRIVHKAT